MVQLTKWMVSTLLLLLDPPREIKPKVLIINQFILEAKVWHTIPELNLLEQNINVPGLSPLFPDVHCTRDGSVCQVVTGQGEINAAATISALLYSEQFDLASTYFLITGIGGISPKSGTIGSVTFARFAVQVGLQHEFDAREKPEHFTSGYFAHGTTSPGEYPQFIDGTEVFELNAALRDLAMGFARSVELQDSVSAEVVRSNYSTVPVFAPGAAPPSVVACDTATSDTFWSGSLLAEAAENTTRILTNGTGVYCTSQQEDNATLEALLRGALSGLVDFSRIIIMRTGSDFDRQFPGQTAADNLFSGLDVEGPGFVLALSNIRLTGVPVVQGILDGWKDTFQHGVETWNYVGDIFGSLGGQPDFGPGATWKKKMAGKRH